MGERGGVTPSVPVKLTQYVDHYYSNQEIMVIKKPINYNTALSPYM